VKVFGQKSRGRTIHFKNKNNKGIPLLLNQIDKNDIQTSGYIVVKIYSRVVVVVVVGWMLIWVSCRRSST
jgi:hypothetical protein